MPDTLHHPTLRLNLLLLGLFVLAALVLGTSLPDRIPVHFGIDGVPTRWEEGSRRIGMFILLVFFGLFTFGQGYVVQRFLVSGPNLNLLNIPHKKDFLRLPEARRTPVLWRINRMLGLVNTSTLVVFTTILFMTWWSAHQPGGWQARLSTWTLWIAIAFAVVYPLAEVFAITRMIRRKLVEEGLRAP